MQYILNCNESINYRKFDVNNDGKLSKEELVPALQSIGFNPTKSDIKRILDAADTDDDGFIVYDSEEFVGLLQELEDEPYDRVLEAFQHFDKDDNGVIDAKELRNILTTTGDPLTEVSVMIIY